MSNATSMLPQLRTISLFQDLHDDELGLAAKYIFPKKHPAGQTLFFAGMPGELMYVVVSGKLEIYRGTAEGEQKLLVVGPGEFVGEGSLVMTGLRSTNCRVLEDSELLVMTKKGFHELAQTHPSVTTKLLIGFLKTNIIRLRQEKARLEWV